MTEFVPETTSESAALESDDVLEIAFRPQNPGPVSITVHAPWDHLIPPDPTGRRLELVAPDQDEPVATSESRGFFSSSDLHFSVTDEALGPGGEWLARVVNIERMRGTEEFELTVTYPSDTEILTADVDAFAVENELFERFRRSTVLLTSGRDQSVVRLPNVNVGEYRFTVPDLDEDVSGAGEHHLVRERLYDLTAELTRVTLDGGTVTLLYEFDAANYVLVGDWNVRMTRPRIHVAFPLGTTEGSVVTGSPNAVLDFDIESEIGVPAAVEWAIDDFADELRTRVNEALSTGFDRARVHESITEILTPAVDTAVPADATLYGVGPVVQGNLEVKYVAE